MAGQFTAWGFGATNFLIPPGATNALLITPPAEALSGQLHWVAGGTLEIHGITAGTSYAGASLVPLLGRGYQLGTEEVFAYSGPARFYLMATGTTVTCSMIWGMSEPNPINQP